MNADMELLLTCQSKSVAAGCGYLSSLESWEHWGKGFPQKHAQKQILQMNFQFMTAVIVSLEVYQGKKKEKKKPQASLSIWFALRAIMLKVEAAI